MHSVFIMIYAIHFRKGRPKSETNKIALYEHRTIGMRIEPFSLAYRLCCFRSNVITWNSKTTYRYAFRLLFYGTVLLQSCQSFPKYHSPCANTAMHGNLHLYGDREVREVLTGLEWYRIVDLKSGNYSCYCKISCF